MRKKQYRTQIMTIKSIKTLMTALCLMMTLMAFAPALHAQQITIKGKITDVNGESMPGATIRVQGTTIGSISNSDGLYTINVPSEKSILVFSFLGYADQSVQVGKKMEINIVLKESLSEISEITVLGYTQTKRDVTGSISSLNSAQIMERQPVNIYDALQGAAAGVLVTSDSGAPGEGSSVRIRGISTFSDSGANPLYIVDGIQMDDINSINPNDVLSLEVLKDAASAAIYGSRSANGVIIITTKQGVEGPPRVEVKYLAGFSQLSHHLSQANRQETLIHERYPEIGLDAHLNDSTAFAINSDNNYQDMITRTAMRNQVDLSLSGGTKQLKYRGSVQYLGDQGIILTSYANRITGRFNMTYQASKNLRVTSNVNFYTTDKNNISEGNVIYTILRRPANLALYAPNGEYYYYVSGNLNPMAELHLRTSKTKLYWGSVSQALDYKVLPWMDIHGDVAASVLLNDVENFSSYLLNINNQISSGSANNVLSSHLQGNMWINFKQQFAQKHNLSGIIGTSIEKVNARTLRISGQDFVSDLVQTLNAASEILPSGTNSEKTARNLVGFFGRFGYDYDKRYLLNLTIRSDGSSRFGADNRWGYFPSASAGWRFSDESFMEWSKPALNDAKVRFSAGITGQQNIGDYDAQTQYSFGSYYYNNASGVRPASRIGNSTLKWEKTEQYNAGIDLDFLQSRVVITGDYYVRNTNDLLYDLALAYESGYSSVKANMGSVRNKGLELSLKWDVIRDKKFKWTTTFNWSQNKNEIVSLPDADRVDDIWWIGVGSEAGTFYGWKQHGVYAYNESNAWTPDFKTLLTPVFERDGNGNVIFDKAQRPHLLGYTLPDGSAYRGEVKQQTSGGSILGGGDFIWEELPNADGVVDGNVDSDDRQKLGSGHPAWSAGWQNNLSYKNFNLAFAFYASIGNTVYNERLRERCSYIFVNATLPDPDFIYNTWKYPGQETYVHRRSNFPANTRRGGDYWLEDGSFFRLQSVNFSYKLPAKWTRKVKIDKAEISVYTRNLFTWTNYKGYDPEISQSSVLKPGNDTGRYPRKREFGVGVNFNF
ncbi:MAG: TonB-dependent receptor [Dysgonamonadaceae bacterium]|nr:TonB-dependent receptor [Dysgonamonadaceae bacterium]